MFGYISENAVSNLGVSLRFRKGEGGDPMTRSRNNLTPNCFQSHDLGRNPPTRYMSAGNFAQTRTPPSTLAVDRPSNQKKWIKNGIENVRRIKMYSDSSKIDVSTFFKNSFPPAKKRPLKSLFRPGRGLGGGALNHAASHKSPCCNTPAVPIHVSPPNSSESLSFAVKPTFCGIPKTLETLFLHVVLKTWGGGEASIFRFENDIT